jgi:hypothetical protein
VTAIRHFLGSDSVFPFLWATVLTISFNITLRKQIGEGLRDRVLTNAYWFTVNWLIGRFCVKPTEALLTRLLGG